MSMIIQMAVASALATLGNGNSLPTDEVFSITPYTGKAAVQTVNTGLGFGAGNVAYAYTNLSPNGETAIAPDGTEYFLTGRSLARLGSTNGWTLDLPGTSSQNASITVLSDGTVVCCFADNLSGTYYTRVCRVSPTGVLLSANRYQITGLSSIQHRNVFTDGTDIFVVSQFTVNTSGHSLAKISMSTQEVLWTTNVQSSSADALAYDGIIDGNGNIFVAGYEFTNSVGAVSVSKYTSTGVFVARNVWYITGDSVANSLAIDANNNLYVAGSCATSQLLFVRKYNSDFTIAWTKTISGVSQNQAVPYAINIAVGDAVFVTVADVNAATNFLTLALSDGATLNSGQDGAGGGVYYNWRVPSLRGNKMLLCGGNRIIRIDPSTLLSSRHFSATPSTLVSAAPTGAGSSLSSSVVVTRPALNASMSMFRSASDPITNTQVGAVLPFVAVDGSTGGDGLVWVKARPNSAANQNNYFIDSISGPSRSLISNTTAAQAVSNVFSGFTNAGFTLPATTGLMNDNNIKHQSFTFKEAEKFFDIVKYTGNGTGQALSHNLKVAPGFAIIKRNDAASNWVVSVRGLGGFGLSAGGAGNNSSNTTTNGMNGFPASDGIGGGGGGAGFYGGNGGAGSYGGGGGGAAGYSATQVGGRGGDGIIVVLYNSTVIFLSGNATWTVPANVTSIKVWVVGAGGGGAGAIATDASAGGGGGAGGCAVKTIAVIAGNQFNYSTGTGGTPGTGGASGLAGGATGFSNATLGIALQGNGGSGGRYNGGVGPGGAASGGDINSTGGSGATASGDQGGGGGGGLGGSAGTNNASNGGTGASAADVGNLSIALGYQVPSLGNKVMFFNDTAVPATDATSFLSADASNVNIGSSASINTNGGSYTMYLWAHDTSSTGIIQSGVVAGTGTGVSIPVELGWEPQFVMIRNVTAGGNWCVYDIMRNMLANAGSGVATGEINPNLAAMDSNTENTVDITTSGFNINSTHTTGNASFAYMVIRRSVKKPITGTDVYMPFTGSYSSTEVTPGWPVDAVFTMSRAANIGIVGTRQMGSQTSLCPQSTAAEGGYGGGFGNADSATGFIPAPALGSTLVSVHALRRRRGCFDVACWKGSDGLQRKVKHNLGVAPELIISKARTFSSDWPVYSKTLGATKTGWFNTATTNTWTTDASRWANVEPTDTDFTVGPAYNNTSDKHMALLFATVAGVSKVGSFTGTGASQVVDCGFSNGARFVLLRRADGTGQDNWMFWDSARGITSGNSPHSNMNNSAAETSDNTLVSNPAGFALTATTINGMNTPGGLYIFVAFA